jgi:hypothetical protein
VAKASKQDAAEDEQPESLPEADLMPPEEHRQEPVPQVHDNLAEDPNEQDHGGGSHQENPPFLSHVVPHFLMNSS